MQADSPLFLYNYTTEPAQLKQVIAPGAARRYTPLTAVRLAADLRPPADGSAVHTSLVAGQLQAASVPIA